ncbi:hypothetical protein CASFOL_027541 [Castilleja foliolosa]|uniref:ZF-HD dimerization-type domain-containing protein n=1 Tax=Castilleja foliolosa TaxID=1961234 RepID=A0ABD3CIA7_9LAMI
MEQNRVSFGDCLKAHAHIGGKVDGCQEFKANNGGEECSICNCHMNYHRRIVEVVYMECHKNHYVKGSNVKDGCKEYMENECSPTKCAACNCHKSFHRNELIIRRLENRVSTEVQGKGCEKVEKVGGDKGKSLIEEAEKQKDQEYTPNMEDYKRILTGDYGDDDDDEDFNVDQEEEDDSSEDEEEDEDGSEEEEEDDD